MIRETRSARPGGAADDDQRGAVYGAALQQFEELMRASATTGYAARPLPLFYAVSQAGRAIAAAWADDEWRLSGHGLKHTPAASCLESVVRPDGSKTSSFSRVAAATKQGSLTAPVQLGALWASLPDLYGYELREERWRRPLQVVRENVAVEHMELAGQVVRASLGVLPPDLLNGLDGDEFDDAVESELGHYPSLEGWQLSKGFQAYTSFDGWMVNVSWQAEKATLGALDWEFENHAFQHRIRGQWWTRPDLNEAGDFLWPLMTWWTLLFGLSMLARYHPAEWTAALRVDESSETVPLEVVLDRALVAVPHFVLEAVIGEQVTVAS